MERTKSRPEGNPVATKVLAIFDRQQPVLVNERRAWYFDDLSVQYILPTQAEAYLALNRSHSYSTGMHDAETTTIHNKMGIMLKYMGPKVSVVDLGCGEGLKSRDIAKAAQDSGKSVAFYPVDISERLLQIAGKNGTESGLKTVTILHDLADLETILKMVKEDGGRFFYIGSNFSFFGQEILRKITGVMSESDAVYISVQLNTPTKPISEIVEQYANDTNREFAFGGMASLGIKPDDVKFSVRFNHSTSNVEVIFTILNVPTILSEKGVIAGDDVIVGKSFKPSFAVFERQVNEYCNGDFFVDQGSFAGFVGHKIDTRTKSIVRP